MQKRSSRGPEPQETDEPVQNSTKTRLFLYSSIFLLCFYSIGGKKAFNTLREALKECYWARLKLKYVPGGWELRLGCHLFSYFHFQRGLCSNFPAISLGLGVGNCQYEFSGKLIRVHAVVHTWPLPEENASTLLVIAVCVNESVNQTFSTSWPTKLHSTSDFRLVIWNLRRSSTKSRSVFHFKEAFQGLLLIKT